MIVTPKEKDSCNLYCQKLMEMKTLLLPDKHCMRGASCAGTAPRCPSSHAAGSHVKNVLDAEKEMTKPSLLRECLLCNTLSCNDALLCV